MKELQFNDDEIITLSVALSRDIITKLNFFIENFELDKKGYKERIKTIITFYLPLLDKLDNPTIFETVLDIVNTKLGSIKESL